MIVEATDTRGTDLPLQNRYGRIPSELFKKEAFQLLAEFVRECVLEKRRHVYDRGICIKFVKSGFVSE